MALMMTRVGGVGGSRSPTDLPYWGARPPEPLTRYAHGVPPPISPASRPPGSRPRHRPIHPIPT